MKELIYSKRIKIKFLKMFEKTKYLWYDSKSINERRDDNRFLDERLQLYFFLKCFCKKNIK